MHLVPSTALFYASTFIGHEALPTWAPYVLWPVYWMCQGVVCTGIWVIGTFCPLVPRIAP